MPVTFTKALRAHIDKRPKLSSAAKAYWPKPDDPYCEKCEEQFPAKRKELGFSTCLQCSDTTIVLANAAMHKQAYTYERNPQALAENPYSTHK